MRCRTAAIGLALTVMLALPAVQGSALHRRQDVATLPGYFQYSATELGRYETSLKLRMNAVKQAAERLGDYGDTTAWIAHREADGLAEIHEEWMDLMFVQSGEALLRVGGTIDEPYLESPGELRGPRVTGGTTRRIGAGDVVNVPAGMQHQFLISPGSQITFFTMKIRSRRR